MKNLLIFLLLLVPSSSFAASVSDLNPISHWSVDESSGVRYDRTLTNDLTDNNTVSSAAGLLSLAADFESSNSEYLSIADGSQTGLDFTTAFSISTWVKFESTGSHMALLSKIVNDSTGGGYSIFRLTTNSLIFRWSNSTTGLIDTSVTFNPNTTLWYHLVFTFNSSSGSVIYINGSSAGTNSSTVAASNGTEQFTLGARSRNGGGTKDMYFDGLQDEISVFDYALSSTEVTTLYNGGTPLPYELESLPANICVYATITDMNNISGMTCSTDGATTTCSYATTSQSVPVQVTSGDILFGLSLIFFILAIFFIGFVINPFKTTWKK